MGFTLKVTAGPGAGQSLSFDQAEVTFGRTSDNDVVLYDPNVSRRHFHIVQSGGGYLLEDLGSSNGTQVNGHGVQSHPLSSGDQISAGDAVFVFQEAGARRSAPPARRSRGGGEAPAPAPRGGAAPAAPRSRGGAGGVPARRGAEGGDQALSARERFKARQAESTPMGRAKAWYGRLEPGKQKLVLAGGGVAALLLVLVIASAGGGGGAVFQKDWSDDVLELAGPVTTTTFGLGVKDAKLARYQVNFKFRYLDGRATLVYDIGWIDSDQEVEIRLNEERIVGYAPMALNTWEETIEVILPHDALIQSDFNTLTFDNTRNPGEGPDETWAVRNVRVIEDPLPEPDPVIAQQRFDIAKDRWEKRQIAPENLYEACREFQATRDYLERMDMKPPLYDAATSRAKECKKELESAWRKIKFSFLKAVEFKDYQQAEGLLRQGLKYFPDEGDPKNRMIKEKLSAFE
ncbi:MAG: FHA domain-containing protein [Deltaproteobacteria bacterium]|nr:FHA domain-containing protein [Deltaproteobacteria bacterium]